VTPAASEVGPRLVGRFDRSDPRGPKFRWSGTSFEARFRGRGVAVRLGVAGAQVPYTAVVDGRAPFTFEARPGEGRYELARDLDPGSVHTVSLTREAEASAGVHQLLGFEADGGVEPAPAPAARLEILGDSITCGYGLLGDGPSCPFSYRTERATLAYGALAARAVGADLVTTCWSGRGVVRNYDGSTEDTMPEIFARVGPADRAPDWLVIALGTNDFLGGGGAPLDVPAFERGYVALLRAARERYPRAHVVVATSPMLGDDPPPWAVASGASAASAASGASAASAASAAGRPESARELARASFERIVAARHAAGDRDVSLFDMEHEGARLGCDYHPNAEMHRVLGAALARVLMRLGRRGR
jgi:lysophospholipase L1-like esterase